MEPTTKLVTVLVYSEVKAIHSPDFDTSCRLLDQYLKKHQDTWYYGAPREEFSLSAAIQQAKDNGKTFVIVEDLS